MAIYNGGLSIKNVSIGTATGSGNAITSLSADGNVITPDKGSTFLTAQDISGKEDKSNKVTAWSSTTTDAHYPSEKLVKSALDGKAEKSEIEASVTTNSLTAGAINSQGSADIGSENARFNNVYVHTLHVYDFSSTSLRASQRALAYYNVQGGKTVYVKAITVTLTGKYLNSCITWHVSQRNYASYYIDLFLTNQSDSTAEIDYLGVRTKFNNLNQVHAVARGNTVDIYIKKTEAYDAFSIISCEYNDPYMSGLNITYNSNDYVTSLPSGALQASCNAYIGRTGLYGAVFN